MVGAGVAGLAAALAARDLQVTVLTKSRLLAGSASLMAQGGLAAAVDPADSPELHAADTLRASAGTAAPRAVRLMTAAAPGVVQALMDVGTRFDRKGDGTLSLHQEAGHSCPRVLHAHGDATGAEIVRSLGLAVAARPTVDVIEEADVVALHVEAGRVCGVWLLQSGQTSPRLLRAENVLLATGGTGQIFRWTTNPLGAVGDGLRLAMEAGAELKDLEFVQFHPTALAVSANPRPLVTEALRGAGAELVTDDGSPLMAGVHPDADLAPRDVVARRIWRLLEEGRSAYLDCRRALGEDVQLEFPTVYQACRAHGIDPAREPIPVTPAAHYHMGGVMTDLEGRTTVPGLWAAGEVACTGVHGANRLASNSLLEGLVFGRRAANAIMGELAARPERGRLRASAERGTSDLPGPAEPLPPAVASRRLQQPVLAALGAAGTSEDARQAVRDIMWQKAGLIRNEPGLAYAEAQLLELARRPLEPTSRSMVAVGLAIVRACRRRRASVGAHFRDDSNH